MLKNIFMIALGGGAGSVLRYLTTVFFSRYYSHSFPVATLITNIIGCFLIGILMGFFTRMNLANSDLKWLLVTGFCGGYTTFSAFGYENASLFQQHHTGLALVYIALSIILGISAVGLGLFLTR